MAKGRSKISTSHLNSKKIQARKKVKKVSRKFIKKKSTPSLLKQRRVNPKKIKLVLNNLILFTILFLASLLLYYVSSDELLVNLFSLLAMVFGFIAGAFLIVLLVFFFLRVFSK